MDEACNLRLQALELEQKAHKALLEKREANELILTNGLNNINKTLLQAKTAVYTTAAVILLQSLGVFETLKLLLFK